MRSSYGGPARPLRHRAAKWKAPEGAWGDFRPHRQGCGPGERDDNVPEGQPRAHIARHAGKFAVGLILVILLAGCVPLPEVVDDAPGAVHLVAQRASIAPVVDGAIDASWNNAVPLDVPLAWGMRGTDHAYTAELRALYTADAIYFLARWPDATLPLSKPEERRIANKLTVHWRIPPPAAGLAAPACDVACHTAFSDGSDRIVDLHTETIPPGTDEALPVAGRLRDGAWTVEWSRPLQSDNPNDLPLTDLRAAYPFFVKVFEGREGRPDPVSALHTLVFEGEE